MKVPVTLSDIDQRNNQRSIDQNSPLESSIHYEACLVTKFRENSNIVNVVISSGKLIEDVRVITPIKLVLMFLGPVSDVKNVPGVLCYRYIPEDGFVMLGDIGAFEYSKEEVSVIKPFYV